MPRALPRVSRMRPRARRALARRHEPTRKRDKTCLTCHSVYISQSGVRSHLANPKMPSCGFTCSTTYLVAKLPSISFFLHETTTSRRLDEASSRLLGSSDVQKLAKVQIRILFHGPRKIGGVSKTKRVSLPSTPLADPAGLVMHAAPTSRSLTSQAPPRRARATRRPLPGRSRAGRRYGHRSARRRRVGKDPRRFRAAASK